jgi:hypothetical protein
MTWLTLGSLAGGCGSGGQWGFSREYSPLSSEENAAEGAREYDPVMVGRKFHEWVGKRVSVFGIVEEHGSADDGSDRLLLSIRTLQDRNLCETGAEDSCRVTVSEHEFAQLDARVQLKPTELEGEHRLGRGSLVRIIGKISKPRGDDTERYVIVANYYRHWPSKYFVTTADRDYMKR